MLPSEQKEGGIYPCREPSFVEGLPHFEEASWPHYHIELAYKSRVVV
jgi:hypothetical protein